MKREIIDEEHCPYCKRHCPLNNPHCKKGKALAKEKEVKNGKSLPYNKDDKKSNKKKKLTKHGLESVKKHINERSEEKSDPFSVLSKEEKGCLEQILKKLYADWNR